MKKNFSLVNSSFNIVKKNAPSNKYLDVVNELSNITYRWINQWAYQDCYNKLIKLKKKAFAYKKEIKTFGFDVKSIYKQLKEFERCVARIKTITKTREEAIILAALKYAKEGKTIVFPCWLSEEERLKNFIIKNINFFFDKLLFDINQSLCFFYISHKENADCVKYLNDNFTNFLNNAKFYSKLYKEEQVEFYTTPILIAYCKVLIKQKDFAKVRELLEIYTPTTIGMTDLKNLEKIKDKVYKK